MGLQQPAVVISKIYKYLYIIYKSTYLVLVVCIISMLR